MLAFYLYIKERPDTPMLLQAAAGACIITVYEFCVGLVVNIWYGWGVWDYSAQPGNLMGQICPLFTFIWFLICLSLLLLKRFQNMIESMYKV